MRVNKYYFMYTHIWPEIDQPSNDVIREIRVITTFS